MGLGSTRVNMHAPARHEQHPVHKSFLLARAIPDGLLSSMAGLGLFIAYSAARPKKRREGGFVLPPGLVELQTNVVDKDTIKESRNSFEAFGMLEMYNEDLKKDKEYEKACIKSENIEKAILKLEDKGKKWRIIGKTECISEVLKAFDLK